MAKKKNTIPSGFDDILGNIYSNAEDGGGITNIDDLENGFDTPLDDDKIDNVPPVNNTPEDGDKQDPEPPVNNSSDPNAHEDKTPEPPVDNNTTVPPVNTPEPPVVDPNNNQEPTEADVIEAQ